MTVYSSDGERLGRVAALGSESFIIEKGHFFPKEYEARYSDVASLAGGEIRLTRDKASLHVGEVGPGPVRVPGATTGERRVPLVEEEALPVAQREQVGEVRVHKHVVTDEKTITVPVVREEVRVERVVVEPVEAAPASEAFVDETITVPVMSESVEVVKRPIVREEVRITKERVPSSEQVSTEVRREVADIEGEGVEVGEDGVVEPERRP
jgi:uncharacterized protein (TIGR02271 family)